MRDPINLPLYTTDPILIQNWITQLLRSSSISYKYPYLIFFFNFRIAVEDFANTNRKSSFPPDSRKMERFINSRKARAVFPRHGGGVIITS